MPRAVYVASGTGDAQAVTGAATMVGFSVVASGGAATAYIRNGTTAADPIVAVINLAAAGSQTSQVPAVDCANGVFVDRVTGTSELVVYVL